MKSNIMVVAVLFFGMLVTFITPHLVDIAFRDNSYSQTEEQRASKAVIDNSAKEENDDIELAIADSAVIPEKKEEEKKAEEKKVDETKVVKEENVAPDPIVYDNLTYGQLVAKIDRSLGGMKGNGQYFVKYSLQYGVDPYLVTAISLHETGCSWKCSSMMRKCNNVGGMKYGSSSKCDGTSYAYFNTLEAGIQSFIYNIKTNYYDKGLTTPEAMNSRYAASTSWSAKVNSFINRIKNS